MADLLLHLHKAAPRDWSAAHACAAGTPAHASPPSPDKQIPTRARTALADMCRLGGLQRLVVSPADLTRCGLTTSCALAAGEPSLTPLRTHPDCTAAAASSGAVRDGAVEGASCAGTTGASGRPGSGPTRRRPGGSAGGRPGSGSASGCMLCVAPRGGASRLGATTGAAERYGSIMTQPSVPARRRGGSCLGSPSKSKEARVFVLCVETMRRRRREHERTIEQILASVDPPTTTLGLRSDAGEPDDPVPVEPFEVWNTYDGSMPPGAPEAEPSPRAPATSKPKAKRKGRR